MDIFNFTINDFQIFLLILSRIGGIFTFAPLLGTYSIPAQIKVAFSLFITMLLFPIINKSGIIIPPNVFDFFVLIFIELAVGFIIGFSATFIFSGIKVGGEFIGKQINIDMGDMFDPISNTNVTVVANLKTIFASLIFLIINGHHWLIKAFTSSYALVPLSKANFSLVLANKLVEMSSIIFIIGIKISAPILITSFLMTVVLGIMERTAGGLNVFSVGFCMQIGTGLLMLILLTPIYLVVFEKIFLQLNYNLDVLLTALKPI